MSKQADNRTWSNSKKSEKKRSCTMVQGQGRKWLPKKEDLFEHAHSDLPVSLGQCLFSYEAGIANIYHILHLWATVLYARLKAVLEEKFPFDNIWCFRSQLSSCVLVDDCPGKVQSVSQGWICFDSCMCCHIEMEVYRSKLAVSSSHSVYWGQDSLS